jgi:hypothetical protein
MSKANSLREMIPEGRTSIIECVRGGRKGVMTIPCNPHLLEIRALWRTRACTIAEILIDAYGSKVIAVPYIGVTDRIGGTFSSHTQPGQVISAWQFAEKERLDPRKIPEKIYTLRATGSEPLHLKPVLDRSVRLGQSIDIKPPTVCERRDYLHVRTFLETAALSLDNRKERARQICIGITVLDGHPSIVQILNTRNDLSVTAIAMDISGTPLATSTLIHDAKEIEGLLEMAPPSDSSWILEIS